MLEAQCIFARLVLIVFELDVEGLQTDHGIGNCSHGKVFISELLLLVGTLALKRVTFSNVTRAKQSMTLLIKNKF